MGFFFFYCFVLFIIFILFIFIYLFSAIMLHSTVEFTILLFNINGTGWSSYINLQNDVSYEFNAGEA